MSVNNGFIAFADDFDDLFEQYVRMTTHSQTSNGLA